MRNTKLVLTVFLSLAAAGFAFAEENNNVEDLWKDLDVNADFVVSLEEAKQNNMAEKQWEVLDLNKDGELSFNEFSLIEISSDSQ